LRPDRRQPVVAREGNEHMISDAADIHDDLRRQCLGENSVQIVDHAGIGSRARFPRARRNPALAWLCVVLGVLLGGQARGADEWFLLPEPKFMGHQVAQPIPDAKKTVLAVAQVTTIGIEFPSRERWADLGIAEAALLESSRKLAAGWLAQLKPEFTRDKKKVVQFAVLQSGEVPVAATVLAPEFWRQFEEIFGPKMRVVIPNRQTVFVFPDVGTDLDQYAPMVIQAWRSRWPKVSLEVLELSEKGLRAIGSFEEP
jgi:hypothetical protein